MTRQSKLLSGEPVRLDSPIYGAGSLSHSGKIRKYNAGKKRSSFSSTRRTEYRGKKISVRTTYRIEIEDDVLQMHIMVLDDGSVHCHGLPNYSFSSALDLARAIVDASALAKYDHDELSLTTDEAEHGKGKKS